MFNSSQLVTPDNAGERDRKRTERVHDSKGGVGGRGGKRGCPWAGRTAATCRRPDDLGEKVGLSE